MAPPDSLAPHTTLRLGGPADRLDRADTAADVVDLFREADAAGEPVVLLGGGSNVVIADEGVRGRVVLLCGTGRSAVRGTDGTVLLTVEAGEDWDGVVAAAVADGLGGIECLSGIPGRAGATPVQNVGAYGTEIGDVLVDVDLYDRPGGTVRTVPAVALGLGYRTSVLRGRADAIVLRVRLRLTADGLSAPVRYEELAGELGVPTHTRVPVAAAREAVLALRRRKGMVLDADDHDTWSAGSFFTNPIVVAEAAPEGVRAWPAGPGRVKLSAAALIERAGFRRGHPGPGGRVALSGKHVLALTNRGGATTSDLLGLAREVRDGVRGRVGVELVPEPVLVGCAW
ncbi:UDP-N-acetylmuramate dehydrogenase [Pseudonocardia sp.]|uniref:UDP-N-acetylmuramate dehydrogenase n=1 Tax=Pseudonocardia sp. TaxID=60912 RepID=UPI003D0A121B